MNGKEKLFPRGDGPLVSVLLPTRGRPKWLIESMCSLWDTADDRSRIEFVLKVDNDDEGTMKALEGLSPAAPVKGICSPRGKGYHDVHIWYADLAREASGDWLFLWNDDARMLSPRWDTVLTYANLGSVWHECEAFCLFSCYIKGQPYDNEFIIFRRKAFQLMGHLSRTPHTDNWLWTVYNMIGSAFKIPILVEHLYKTDEAKATRQDDGEIGRTTIPEYNTRDRIWERIEDAIRLMNHIEREKDK